MLDNLLLTALTVIPPEPIQYQKWLGLTTNAIGLDVPTYASAVSTQGSIQHQVSEKMYQAYGLDLNKNYALVNIPAEVLGLNYQASPDRLLFGNKNWIVIKCNNWYSYNGWVKLLVVEEKDYTGVANDG